MHTSFSIPFSRRIAIYPRCHKCARAGDKRIDIRTIESVEKTWIPFGIRLFGASFHGGYYQIPGLGRTYLAITNFTDGLLIKNKDGNYIITPKNPMDFKKKIEDAKAKFLFDTEDGRIEGLIKNLDQ